MRITAKTTIKNYALRANVPGSLSAEVANAVSQIVRKTAFDIQAEAQSRTPVDTGALKSSIFVRTKDMDTYSGAESAAKSLNPEAETFDSAETPEVTSAMKAIVAVAVKYGYWVHNGTRKMSARPFLAEAILAKEDAFIKAVGEAVQEAAKGVSI